MRANRIPLVYVLLPALALAGLTLLVAAPAGAPSGQGASQWHPAANELLDSIDRSADPCRDFYQYACGSWLDTTELPADQSRWVRSFSVIRETNREVVRDILQEAAAKPGPPGTDHYRIGTFYASCMDEEAVAEAGTKPLEPFLNRIAGIESAADTMKTVGALHRIGAQPLLELGVLPDFKNPDLNIGFMSQGGLGLPDRDYYVGDDPKKQQVKTDYEAHVARMLGLLGRPPEAAAKSAAAIVAFETRLAEASRPIEEMRIPEKLYNRLDIGGLKKLAPDLAWDAFRAGTGYPDLTELNVATPEFFEALQGILAETAPAVVRDYLTWHLVDAAANLLPDPFVQANFEFYGKKLSGQQEIQPRWKRCVAATEGALGEAVGRLYVEQRFAGDSKEKALEMIRDIETAFEQALPDLAWMDEATRKRALEKARAVGNKIGFPETWRDYSKVTLRPGDHFGNALAAVEFEFDREARKVGKPVDEQEWRMTPQMVNAYYNPLINEIAFPAGILQPPFFHRDLPAAMNYGAVGAVVGHELTHGFDDQGRKFDAEGKLREWWEPAVAEKFEQRADCVRTMYSGFEVEPGVAVNGVLTAGENIADIGGVKQAYAAYELYEQRHGIGDEPALPGLTNDQLFFVSWAQTWCTETTPEFLRLQVATDPHSPGQFRANGPLMSNPDFARAFGCENAPMAPAARCEVW